MLDHLAVGWKTPRYIEIGAAEEQPNDADPRESKKEALDKDTDEDAD